MSDLAFLQPEEESEQGGVVKGVAIGVVTRNEDDEGGMARVKVRFPWHENPNESHWARLALPMAGNDRGTYFVPEIDDEVLCVFEREDIRHPYIVGCLWNGQDAPPEGNDNGKNDIRKVKTRIGHELIFDDGDEPSVHLKTHDDREVYMDGSVIRVTDGSSTIVLESDSGAVKVEASGDLTMTGVNVTLEASGTMGIKAGGTMTIEGSLVSIN